MAGGILTLAWLLVQLVAYVIAAAYVLAALVSLLTPPILVGYWIAGRRG